MDEFRTRFNDAKAHRGELLELVGREVYKYCFNGRESEWDRTTTKDTKPEEIFTDFPATVAEDFHGDLFSTMTPENTPWVEFEAGNAVDEDQANQAKEEIAEYEKSLAKSVRASNYYDEGQTAFQDAVVGTVAMWVDKPQLTRPAVCEAIPLPQLYLRLGPYGLADRFRVQKFYARDLPALFPTAKFTKKLQDKIKNSPNSRVEVIRGFWPTYDDPENPTWVKAVRVDWEPIGIDEEGLQAGAVAIVCGRFNPIAGSAWGRGPGFRMLPTIRVLNAVSEMTLEGMDRNLDPAYVYPHDGILDLSDGIENGIGYPSMPGSGDAIRPIGTVDSLEYGLFSEEALETKIREGFYRQTPQRGKTPPSASQYIGEEQKELRRMARPSAKLWQEFGVGLLKRFEFLERMPGGILQDVRLPLIEEGVVNVRPISPLERSQAREEVMTAQSIMAMAMETVGPEQANMLIDMPGSMRNVKDKLKDQIVSFRTEEQILAIMQSMGGPASEQ
jgi:hypothetical protein